RRHVRSTRRWACRTRWRCCEGPSRVGRADAGRAGRPSGTADRVLKGIGPASATIRPMSTSTSEDGSGAFRRLPFMGVIRVNNEAAKVGYRMGDPSWSNLGQVQPEVGDLAGAPPRMNAIPVDPADHAYGPVEGLPELRQAVADHYNRLYRRGRASQYTAENVAIGPGGRAVLTRIGATLEQVRLGYFTPDYTAYEDLLVTFQRLDPVWIELKAEDGFRISPAALEE